MNSRSRQTRPALLAALVALVTACVRPPSEPAPTPTSASLDAAQAPASDAASTSTSTSTSAADEPHAAAATAGERGAMPSPPALDGPLPERHLTFERSRAFNRHWVDGADGERLAAAVALDLLASGAAELRQVGEHRRSVLHSRAGSPNRHRETIRRWRSTWAGYWRASADGFTVTVEPRESTCAIEENERIDLQHRTEREDCPPTASLATIRCTPSAVGLRKDVRADRGEETPTWRCTTDDELNGDPPPWEFGQARCIHQAGGMRGRRGGFIPCTGEPSFDAASTTGDDPPE